MAIQIIQIMKGLLKRNPVQALELSGTINMLETPALFIIKRF